MPEPEAAIRDGLFLEYRVEGSTSPGRFVYCDAELRASSFQGLLSSAPG